MLRFDFTDDELEKIKKQVRFTPRQLKIIEYRRQERTLVEMSQLIPCDVSTITRELNKIAFKIALSKVI